MRGIRQRFLGLCLPPVAFFALDMSLTLHGQPAEYWAGNYSRINEASPTLGNMLQISPFVFVLACTIFAIVAIIIILLLPEPLALIASIAGVMSGAFGASTWLLYNMRLHYGYQWMELLILLAASTIGLAIRYGWQARPAAEYRLSIPNPWRYGLAATLVAIVLWLAFRTPG